MECPLFSSADWGQPLSGTPIEWPTASASWRGVVRLRIVQGRQIVDHGKESAAAAGRVGRCKGSNHGVDQHHGLAQREHPGAHRPYEQQRNAPSASGLLVAEGEHEGAENQPDRAVAEARKRQLRLAFVGLKPGFAS